MLAKPVNLAIVDDHALFRKTLLAYLSEQKDIHITFQASDIFDLLRQLKDSSVDILLMDVFLPDLNGNVALKEIRAEYPEMKILVLSMSRDMHLISDMLDSGIHGYISKADEPDELLMAIQAIASNRIYRNYLLTEALYWNKQHNTTSVAEEIIILLNDREKRLLQLIWEEKSNKEIADELVLGIRSVEKLRQDLKGKVGVRSTVGLLKYAINKGLIGFSRHSTF